MKTTPTRQEQADNTRHKIILAVSESLKENDLRDVKVRDICKRAGVSVGTFYLYFPCKEAALLYGYREADEVFDNLTLDGSAQENLTSLISTHLQMVSAEFFPVVKQIYICHLSYYDSYFFDEARPLFLLIFAQLEKLCPNSKSEQVKSIAWRLLSLVRGSIYNLCIRPPQDIPDWQQRQLSYVLEYAQFLIDKEKRI